MALSPQWLGFSRTGTTSGPGTSDAKAAGPDPKRDATALDPVKEGARNGVPPSERWGRAVGEPGRAPNGPVRGSDEARSRGWRDEERGQELAPGDSRLVTGAPSRAPTSGQRNPHWKDPTLFPGGPDVDAGLGAGGRGGGRFSKDDPRSQARARPSHFFAVMPSHHPPHAAPRPQTIRAAPRDAARAKRPRARCPRNAHLPHTKLPQTPRIAPPPRPSAARPSAARRPPPSPPSPRP